MKIPFLKKSVKVHTIDFPEQKSAGFHQGIFSQGSGGDQQTLNPSRAIRYYKGVAPVANAVNYITDEVAGIDLRLHDDQENEFVQMPEINNILYNPNPDQTYSEFMKAMATFLLVAGNSYMMINSSSPSGRPLEIICLNPSNFTITGSSIYPDQYVYTSTNKSITFTKKETSESLRYFANGGKSELIHIKMFNPDMGSTRYEALSPLQPIQQEIMQYVEQATHNLSLLNKGVRTSGIITSDVALNDDQIQSLKSQISNNQQGAANAGRPMVFSGANFKFIELGKNQLDMDFEALRKEIMRVIYTTYKIPLPLIAAESMTMNNYREAQFSFFNNAVFPVLNKFAVEFERAMFQRYGLDTDRYSLGYDESQIPAIRERHYMNIQRLQETGALSINEIRQLNGYKDLESGGDQVRLPANLLPIGSTDSDDPDQDLEDIAENEDEQIKSVYRKAVKDIKRGYSNK